MVKNIKDESDFIAELFSTDHYKSSSNNLYRNLAISVSMLIIVAIVVGFGVKIATNNNSDGVSQVNDSAAKVLGTVTSFEPYYFDNSSLPEGTAVDEANISLDSGVLFIPINTSNGQLISVSQQLVPEDFSNSIPVGKEIIETPAGNGALSEVDGRITINIITDKNVFILINAPASVDSGTVKAIAQSIVK